MAMRALGLFIAFAAGVAIASCDEGDIGTGATCEPTTAAVAAIFAESCSQTTCHNATDHAGSLDLVSPELEARLVERPSATCDRTLVVPGAPDLSFLYEKLVAATPECGAPMPLANQLTEPELACVRDWIATLPEGCETCGGSGCADLSSDPQRCGGCDVVCPTGATCQSGECVCPAGRTACGSACVDTASNPAHCGGCDTPCGADEVCSGGLCKADCDAGLTECSQACVDTQTDPSHCGDCDESCGNGSCSAGQCDCGPGIDPQTDPENCGSCGNACAPGQSCTNGACTCATSSVSFAATIQPIFDAHCSDNGCHAPPSPKEGLDLSPDTAYDALVGVLAEQCSGRLRVAPGDPDQSYLVDKLLGRNLCSGTRMPKISPLAPTDVEAITSWICGGAADD